MIASSFWGKWWEISLCCCHPLGYDLGVVLYVVRHDFSHAYRCFDISFLSDCFHVLRHGESFGLVCCDWSGFLTCVLVCSVLFGFPGMVSYGLDHLY